MKPRELTVAALLLALQGSSFCCDTEGKICARACGEKQLQGKITHEAYRTLAFSDSERGAGLSASWNVRYNYGVRLLRPRIARCVLHHRLCVLSRSDSDKGVKETGTRNINLCIRGEPMVYWFCVMTRGDARISAEIQLQCSMSKAKQCRRRWENTFPSLDAEVRTGTENISKVRGARGSCE